MYKICINSVFQIVGCTVGVLFITIIINVLSQYIPRRRSEPPLVFHFIPFIGNAISFGKDPCSFYKVCQKKYGDIFTFVLLGRKMTVYLGTDGNEFILNGSIRDLNAEKIYSPLTTPVFGSDVIYDCPNSKLMEQKKFFKAGLTRNALASYVPLIEKEVLDYLESKFKGHSGKVNISAVMSEITIFTAGRTLQGPEVRKKLTAEFAEYYHDLDNGFKPINFLVPWAPLPQNRRRDAAHRKMRSVYMELIDRHRNKLNEEPDIISHLLACSYKNGEPIPDKEIAHLMITVLMGGQHSSASTSAWVMLRLASRPDILEELYQEQLQNLGPDMSRPLQYADLDKLPLFENVVKETLRLHSSIHSLMRKVVNPIKIPNSDYVITPDKVLVASPIISHQSPEHFPNAEVWDPHRWDNWAEIEEDTVDYGYGSTKKGTRSPYLPFGAGRHRCIGEKFAYVNIITITLIIVRHLKLATLDGKSQVPPTDYTSLFSRPPLSAEIYWERRVSGSI